MHKALLETHLARLEAPVRRALVAYESLSGDQVRLEIGRASALEPTPDRPNAARSKTPAHFAGELIGDLFVIAFAPGDGTGDESAFKLDEAEFEEPYSPAEQLLPRNKTNRDEPEKGTHSEILMPLVRQRYDTPEAPPQYFGGLFDLVGIRDGKVAKIASVGHRTSDLRQSPPESSRLTPMYTVGYRAGADGSKERFGDPHAVYNPSEYLQVCAFLAVTEAMEAKYPGVLENFHPLEPHWQA